jgi:AraC-like DNA-binding protein
MKPDYFTKPFIPAVYGLLILEVAAVHGVDRQQLLADAGVPAALLDKPDARLTVLQAGGLLYLAMRRSGEPGLGYEIGLHSNLTSHGIMGYGLMSSASLREAIALGEKFVQLRLPMLTIKQFIDGEQAVIDVTETAPLGPTRQCLLDLFLVGLARMAPALTGRAVPIGEVELWFDYAQPDYYRRFAKRLPTVCFDKEVVQLRFPAKYLDFKPATANPVTARMVEEQCAREMEQLGLAGDLVKQVQALITARTEGYPDLNAVAEALHMSARSLKRKLQQHDRSFRQLLDTARYRDSIHLLKHSELTIERIASRLGYADPANFTRAFRKWSGMTPSAYRLIKDA